MHDFAFAYGGISLLAVAIYLYVGRRLSLRAVPASAQLARDQFSMFWYGLAALSFFQGTDSLLAGVGSLSVQSYDFLEYLTLIAFCVGFWGLVGFLVYLYSGRYHLVLLTLLYSTVYLVLLGTVISLDPIGTTLDAGRVDATFAASASPSLIVVLVLLLIVPEFAGILGYLSLLRHAQDRTLRFRIGLTSGGLLLWFVIALVPSPAPGIGRELWAILDPSIGALAALVILAAYYPPTWIRDRWMVGSIEDHPLTAGPELPHAERPSPGS